MTDGPVIPDAQPDDWTQPGAFPVADGVYRIPLPLPSDGLRAVNVYAIRVGDGLVVVDAGWALEQSRRQFEWALKQIDAKLSDISRFLVTHVHRDHYTQAVAVRREFGARVTLGFGERASLEGIRSHTPGRDRPQARLLRRAGASEILARLAAHDHDVDPSQWELPDDWLRGRTPVPVGERELLAVPTPGHTRGHYVFADLENRLMFTGDHVLPHITPSIGFEYAAVESPLASYLESLAAVRAMPDMLMLPAHGPVGASVHRRVDELLAHHEERLDACAAAVAQGARSAYEVAQVLRWTRRGRHLAELDLFNQTLAVLETAAHLTVLVARGALTESLDGEVAAYAVAEPRTVAR
jgi:glyoxylase-like metal-dependent hydrolase (beta-lactamase superfamily II)